VPAQVYYIDQTEITHSSNAKVEVLHTDWQPPCGGDRRRGDKLSRLG